DDPLPPSGSRLGGWRSILVGAAIGAVAAEFAFQVRFNLREAPPWDLAPWARAVMVAAAAIAWPLGRLLLGRGEAAGARPRGLGATVDRALAVAGFTTALVAGVLLAIGVPLDAIETAVFGATAWVLLVAADRFEPLLRPWRDEVVLGIAWSVLAAWWLWPLPAVWHHSFGLVRRDAPLVMADSYLIAWILAWDTHALATRPTGLFDAPIFFPLRSTLALSEHLLGLQPLFAPVWLATRNAVLGANVVVFLSYPAGALAAYAFARRFVGRPAAAVAGTLWAFHPFRFLQVDERHMLVSWGIPAALFFADRWLERGRVLDAVGFGCVLALQTLSSFYLGYAMLIALGVY
ncbi:MAG: hypothetical protein ACKO2K_07180, partial [Alphaproteobacteria bacterium]